eukprot:3850701-Prymnesium_polylepis.1
MDRGGDGREDGQAHVAAGAEEWRSAVHADQLHHARHLPEAVLADGEHRQLPASVRNARGGEARFVPNGGAV